MCHRWPKLQNNRLHLTLVMLQNKSITIWCTSFPSSIRWLFGRENRKFHSPKISLINLMTLSKGRKDRKWMSILRPSLVWKIEWLLRRWEDRKSIRCSSNCFCIVLDSMTLNGRENRKRFGLQSNHQCQAREIRWFSPQKEAKTETVKIDVEASSWLFRIQWLVERREDKKKIVLPVAHSSRAMFLWLFIKEERTESLHI